MKYIFVLAACCTVILMRPLSVDAQISLEKYCKDGYYQIPGEKKCSRAPHCGGYGYDDLNKGDLMPNNNDCLDEGRGMVVGDPPNSSAFYGYVPLCCYEMERLKNPEMCIGYWERLWCHPDQCKAIDNDHGCGGGGCQCAHAMKGWCEIRHCNMLPPVPLEVRLGGAKPTQPPAPTQPLPPTSPPYRPPTQPPAPTLAIPTTPVQLPTVAAPIQFPTATPVPFRINTPVPIQPPIPENASGTSQVLTRIKTTLRAAVIATDPGFKFMEGLFMSVRQADSRLESLINNTVRSIAGKVGLSR